MSLVKKTFCVKKNKGAEGQLEKSFNIFLNLWVSFYYNKAQNTVKHLMPVEETGRNYKASLSTTA